jgi:hypothetical protein
MSYFLIANRYTVLPQPECPLLLGDADVSAQSDLWTHNCR